MTRPILLVIITSALGGIALAAFFWSHNLSQNILADEPSEFLVSNVVSSTLLEFTPEPVKERRQVPQELRGIYLTRWSAGSAWASNQVLLLAEKGIINAVVIDIKDFSGFLAYDTNVEQAARIGAEQENITDLKAYLDKLHSAGLYSIARLTVFQDPQLAKARPDLAIKKLSIENEVWTDHKGLAWVDPASKEVWEYNVSIAKDALAHGFDEVNFDYVRFPSDGAIFDTAYPFWDEKTPLQEIIASFFVYLSDELKGMGRTSVDLFGLAAANTWDDMGIGQVLEDAFLNFDFISPMVYPSHFGQGFLGFEHPEEHPYEIVYFSMQRAKERMEIFEETSVKRAKLRPWLQYFDLTGSEIIYTPLVVREQIQATKDALGEEYTGYLLWNSANLYPIGEVQEIVFGPVEENEE